MGVAILNVLVLHSLSWSHFNSPGWVVMVLNTFGRLIFTEGFLLISGYGLYYSFHNNSDLRRFYIKRVKRLLIPYWLMTSPFFLVFCLLGKFSFCGLLLRFSTLEFWIHGNYSGMWYVAVSVLLYACMPLIFRLLQQKWGGALIILVIEVVVTIVFFFAPNYYRTTSIGITKLPFFIVGAWVGKKSMSDYRLNVWCFVALVILLVILYMYPVCIWLCVRESVFRLIGIIVCCVALKYTEWFAILHRLLRWFGSYTLEIYILHLLFESILNNIIDNGYVKVVIAIGGALFLCVPVHKGCDWGVKKIEQGRFTSVS